MVMSVMSFASKRDSGIDVFAGHVNHHVLQCSENRFDKNQSRFDVARHP
jgi:hypothetical protein